jgi:hypothetical protein
MRLFFVKSYTRSLEGGGTETYTGGQFYQVDDTQFGAALVANGTAVSEADAEKAVATPAAPSVQADGGVVQKDGSVCYPPQLKPLPVTEDTPTQTVSGSADIPAAVEPDAGA